MLNKDQAESAAEELLRERKLDQHRHSEQLSAGRNRRRWLPIGGVLGLVAGLAIGELLLHQDFPAAIFGLALGAIIGAYLDRGRAS